MRFQLPKESGFSLIELMVVVATIGTLSTVATVKFKIFKAKAAQTEAKVALKAISALQESYFAENGKYAPLSSFGNLGKSFKCTQNALGFGLSGCKGSGLIKGSRKKKNGVKVPNFEYEITISNDGSNYLAKAKSGVGSDNKVLPGCIAPDVWEMTDSTAIEHTSSSVQLCPILIGSAKKVGPS